MSSSSSGYRWPSRRRSHGGVVRALVFVLALGVAGTTDTRVEPTPGHDGTRLARSVVSQNTAPGPAARVEPPDLERTGSVTPAPIAVADQPAPVALRIDAIGVDTTLLDLGLEDDGTMEVPAEGFPAGWYTGAPRPGAIGPAVIAGHVDWGGEPGVFWALRDLGPGAAIEVTREDGSVAVFRTVELEQVAKDDFPTDRVYGNLPNPGLRLITCGGDFDDRTGSYRDNLVAYADLVEIRPAPADLVSVP